MSFLSKTKSILTRDVRTFFKRDLSVTNEKAWNPSLWSLAGSQSLSGETVTESTALTYSAVWCAISLIAGTIATLPLHLMQRKGQKKRIADDRKLYRVLHDEANPFMSAMTFREVLMAHVLAWGNGYAEKVFNTYGDITQLWPIPPNRIRIEMADGNLIYFVRVNNREIPIPRERMLHVPGLGYDGFLGYSIVAMARKSIGLGMAMETFGAMYFGNGTHPGAIVSHPGKLSKQAHENLRDSLVNTYSGLGKAHRLMLLEEGMKIESINIPPSDSQFLECVAPGTLLTMADGTRKAADEIHVGDRVLAWENDKITISHVSAIGAPRNKTLVKIRTARGRELVASEDHPCLAIQKLRTPGCRIHKANPEKWIALKDLKIGSYVRIALDITEINSHQQNRMDFTTGYFLGAMAGDGYIRKQCCTFTNADQGVISKVKEITAKMGGELRQRAHEYNNYNYDIITNGKSGCKGSRIRTLLNNSGLVGKHSKTKTVPVCVMSGGPDAWAGFLSGYFDTDGSIRRKGGGQTPAMYWSSTSIQMLQECQHLLAMLGVQSSIYPMGSGGTKKILGKTCKFLPSWGLYVMGLSQLKRAAETLSLSHIEKTIRLKGYLEAEPSRYREENFLYDRVVSVEEIGEGETIGIEIAGCHTHITGGIVTHNSRQFQIPEIARWFNLPPHKLKDLTKSSFSNIESEQISFVTDSILPWLVRLEQAFNMQLLSKSDKELSGNGRLYFKHIVEGLLRGDAASRGAFYSTMFNIGAMSINEIREKEDLDPVPNGDVHLVPLNMTTLENAGKPQEKALSEKTPDKLKPQVSIPQISLIKKGIAKNA